MTQRPPISTLRVLTLAAAISLPLSLGCEEPPPLPNSTDIDESLRENLAQTRDAASARVENLAKENQEARKRLAPDAGGDASQ